MFMNAPWDAESILDQRKAYLDFDKSRHQTTAFFVVLTPGSFDNMPTTRQVCTPFKCIVDICRALIYHFKFFGIKHQLKHFLTSFVVVVAHAY